VRRYQESRDTSINEVPMRTLRASVAVAATLLGLSSPVLAAIQLVPVVSSGISSPTFVGNAGDGSNRLFITERAGIVRVLQPGSSTPTVFLDIRTKIVSGGEQGLLGLAFHPLYESNGRFFVYYTRAGDGTLVLAEYKVSTSNSDIADPTEKVLLTIPHPTNTNHNGGMLAFGPDGFLYIGVGDGGAGNDPPNNAQNVDVLLGKILRIDINPPVGSGLPYTSPPTNPFFGATAGRDEIFALGLRNPWRFSFDRITGQQWVADVGQGLFEEVDTPIVNGGNYGWRVFEGFACTNNDPALCSNPANYIFPIFDYTHSNGRCSITGGYVYRGSAAAVPSGTYVHGDFCSGEIFAWDGTTQSVLLDTTLSISSFGEDEQGELYVVNLGGTVSKIVPAAPCTYSISPTRAAFSSAGGSASVAVTAPAGCTWTAVSNDSWITITAGGTGSGNGTVEYSIAPNTGQPRNRNGTMTIAGQRFSVKQSR
jgi:glucose/arabinose dehydrogenase